MEIRNPAKLPTDLYPAEQEFSRCLAEGKPCIVGNGDFSTPRPKEGIQSGDNANMIRGEIIRFFAYGGNEENPVLGSMLSLRGAWISGNLNLTHASIPYALMLDNCHFDGFVGMQYAECAALYLNGSHLAQGLFADGLTTKGNVYFRNSFSAEGEVRLVGANIGGDLSCLGGRFNNPGGNALSADGLTVKGSAYLVEGFSAKGAVRLLGSSIGGDLDCADGKFHNPGGKALNADGLTTKGSVNLRDGFSAEGEVRLLGASVNINLSCIGGAFHNPGGNALIADGLTTKGDVFFRDGFSAEGEVRLLGVSIGGDLGCERGKLHNPGGKALDVGGGNISGGLFWRKITCEGDVNLAYARADVLADDSVSWKSCKVILDGFTCNRYVGLVDAQSRIDWLAKRPDKMGFSPLPYEQAAKVLFEMGRVHDAREILLKKEQLLTERGDFSWISKWGRKVWRDVAGHSYRRLQKTFFISLGIMTIGSGLFYWGEQAGRIVPHQPAALVSSKYQYGRIPAETPTETVARKFSGYPEFNPILFSVDIFIPFLDLHQESFWYPAPDGGHQHWWGSDEDGDFSWWVLLEVWYWFHIILGWGLSSLLLFFVTATLRSRKFPGERD